MPKTYCSLLPFWDNSFQLIAGSGLPLARHISVTLEPSFTTKLFEKLTIFGGTKGKE